MNSPVKVVSGNPRTDAEALYEQNLDLLDHGVRAACGFIGLRPHQWEEAYSYARLGLWYAALQYDPTRGASFPTYARWHIRGEMSHYFRILMRRRKLRVIELDAPLADSDLTLLDLLADDPRTRPGALLLAEAGFEALISSLGPRPLECLRWLYQDEEPLTALAEIWGVSRAAVSAMHLRALKQVRQTPRAEQEGLL